LNLFSFSIFLHNMNSDVTMLWFTVHIAAMWEVASLLLNFLQPVHTMNPPVKNCYCKCSARD
jgi:hypothetical protein